MRLLIDTDVAIHLRDGEPRIRARVLALVEAPFLSVISRVELEGGVHGRTEAADARRARLNALLERVTQLPFDEGEARIYGEIVRTCGFSRSKINDRMIAAQAIAAGAVLATMNIRDFHDVPALSLEDWSA